MVKPAGPAAAPHPVLPQPAGAPLAGAPAGGTPPAGRARVRNPLAIRAFRLLWLNNIAFFLVANAERFVFGWLVLDFLDRGEREQGMVVFALGIPAVFVTLHAGVWADRHDRRKMLMATQLSGAAAMAVAGLLVASGRADLFLVMAVAVLAGSAAAIGAPVRSSLIPALVDRERLFGAIAVNALAMTMSMILGPVIVRAVGLRVGFDGAFWFLAGIMVVGATLLMFLEVPSLVDLPPRRKVLAEMRDAVSHVWQDSSLLTLFGLLITASLTVNPAVMVTVQAHVKETLGRAAGDAAMPFAAMGFGIALSSVWVMRSGDMPDKGTVFQRAVIAGSLLTFLMGRTTSLAPLLGLAFLMGLAGGLYINMNQGLIQANTPAPLMGRVMALFTLTQAGFLPLGALVLGAVADVTSTGVAISGAAALAFAVFVTVYVRNRELRRLG